METTSIFRAVADFSALDAAVKKELVLVKALTDQVKAYGLALDATLAKADKLAASPVAGSLKRDSGLVSSGAGQLVASDASKVASGIDKQMAPTTAFLRQLFTNPQFISSMAQMEHALTAALPTAVAGGLEGLGAGADHVAAIAETSGSAASGVSDIGGAAAAAADEFKNADESAVGMGGALEGSTVAAAGLAGEMVKVIADLGEAVGAAGSLTEALLAAAAASGGIHAGIGGTSGLLKDAESELPHLAGGGIVDKPTVALLGEDGAEAVISDPEAVKALARGGSVIPANVGSAPVSHIGGGGALPVGEAPKLADTIVGADEAAGSLGTHLSQAASHQEALNLAAKAGLRDLDGSVVAETELGAAAEKTTAQLKAQGEVAKSNAKFTSLLASGGVTSGVRDTGSKEAANITRDERSIEKETGYLGRAFTQGAEAAKPFFQGLESGGVLAVASIAGIVGIGGELVKMGLDFNEAREQSENTFEAMGKTTDQAKALVATITDVSRGTPFLTSQVQAVTQQMMVMGFTSEQVISGNAKNIGGLFKSIGDAAAAQGPNASQALTGIATAFGRIQAQGGLTALTMRTLVNNGVPAAAILEKAFNLTAAQVANITKQGLSAQQEIDALSKGMEERFGGSMTKAAGTFHGELMTIKSDLSEGMGNALKSFSEQEEKTFGGLAKSASSLAADIGTMGFMPAMQKDLPHLASILSGFVGLWHALYDAVSALTPVVKTFVATLGVGAFVLLETVLKGITAALTVVAKVFGVMPNIMKDAAGAALAAGLAYSVLDDKVLKLYASGMKLLTWLKDIVTGQAAATAAQAKFTAAQAIAADATTALQDKQMAQRDAQGMVAAAMDRQRAAIARLAQAQKAGTSSAAELAAMNKEVAESGDAVALATGRQTLADNAYAKAQDAQAEAQGKAAKLAQGASGLPAYKQVGVKTEAQKAFVAAREESISLDADLLAAEQALTEATARGAAATLTATEAKEALNKVVGDGTVEIAIDNKAVLEAIAANAADAEAMRDVAQATAERDAALAKSNKANAVTSLAAAPLGIAPLDLAANQSALVAQASATKAVTAAEVEEATAKEDLDRASKAVFAALEAEAVAGRTEGEVSALVTGLLEKEAEAQGVLAKATEVGNAARAEQVVADEAVVAADVEVTIATRAAALAQGLMAAAMDALPLLAVAATVAVAYGAWKLYSDHVKAVQAAQFDLSNAITQSQAAITALDNPVFTATKGMDAYATSVAKANAASLQFAQASSKMVKQLASDAPDAQQTDLNSITAGLFKSGETVKQVTDWYTQLKALMGPALTAKLNLDTKTASGQAKAYVDDTLKTLNRIKLWTPAPTTSGAGNGRFGPPVVDQPPGLGTGISKELDLEATSMAKLSGSDPASFFKNLGAEAALVTTKFTNLTQRTQIMGQIFTDMKNTKGSPLASLDVTKIIDEMQSGIPIVKAFTDGLAASPGAGTGNLKAYSQAIADWSAANKGATPTAAQLTAILSDETTKLQALAFAADQTAVATSDLGHVFATTGPLIDSTLPDFADVTSAFAGLTDTTSAWTAALTGATAAVAGLSSAATAIDVSGVSTALGGSSTPSSSSSTPAGPSSAQTASANKDTKAVDAQKAAIDQLKVSQAAAYQQALKGGTVTKAGMAALKAEQLAAMEAADAKLAGLNKVAAAQNKANAATKAGTTATKAAAATDTLSLANVTAAIHKQVVAQQENNAVTAKYGPAIGAAVAGIDKTGQLAKELLSASPAQAAALIGQLQQLGGAQQKYASTTSTAQSGAAASTTQSATTIAAQLTNMIKTLDTATDNAKNFGTNITAITKTYGATVAAEVAKADPTGKLAADIEANPALGKKVVDALQANATEAAASNALVIKLKTEVELDKDSAGKTATQIAQEVGGESADQVVAIAKSMNTKTLNIWATANSTAKGQAPAVVTAYTAGLTKGWNDNVPGVRAAVANFVNNGVVPNIVVMATKLNAAKDLSNTVLTQIITNAGKIAAAGAAAATAWAGWTVTPPSTKGTGPVGPYGNAVPPAPSGPVGPYGTKPVPHAEGGIVSFPTIALLGEAGAEAVIPLRGLGSMADITKAMFPNLNPNLILKSGATPMGTKHSGTHHSEHHEVHQTAYNLGGVTVVTNDPNAMYRALQRKAALRNGTAAKL